MIDLEFVGKSFKSLWLFNIFMKVLTSLWLFKMFWKDHHLWILNFVLELLYLFHWNTKIPFAKRIAFETFALFYSQIILQFKKIYLISFTMCGTYVHNKKMIEIHASLNFFVVTETHFKITINPYNYLKNFYDMILLLTSANFEWSLWSTYIIPYSDQTLYVLPLW
jgi:hypothetical protein